MGGRERHGLPRQRLLVLPDRRGPLSERAAPMTTTTTNDRRAELLDIAARLFAERGLRATTVRDIADAAGILSGSLYHHFDSKESMVDEILRRFLDTLFDRYREIVAQGMGPRATLEAVVVASFEA